MLANPLLNRRNWTILAILTAPAVLFHDWNWPLLYQHCPTNLSSPALPCPYIYVPRPRETRLRFHSVPRLCISRQAFPGSACESPAVLFASDLDWSQHTCPRPAVTRPGQNPPLHYRACTSIALHYSPPKTEHSCDSIPRSILACVASTRQFAR